MTRGRVTLGPTYRRNTRCVPRSLVSALVLIFVPLAAACGSDPAVQADRTAVSVVKAGPTGLMGPSGAIEFALSAPIEGAPTDVAGIAISPPVPLEVRWQAPDTIVGLPIEPLPTNTRFVARLVPTALGSRYFLTPSEPLRFHTPLFAVDYVDFGGTEPAGPNSAIERIWVGFSHPVAHADLEKYVVVRSSGPTAVDIPYSLVGPDPCIQCELVLASVSPKVDLEFAPELRPVGGGVSLEKVVRRRLVAAEPREFRLVGAEPRQERGRPTVVIEGTRAFPDVLPAGTVLVAPQVGHQVRPEGRRLVVTGGFEVGATYAIDVTTTTSRGGATLVEPFSAMVKIPNLRPTLHIRNEKPVLAPTAIEPVEVDTVGVKRLDVRTFSVPIDNLVHVLDNLDRPASPRWPSLGRWTELPTISVAGRPGAVDRSVLSLPDAARPGLRLLEVRSNDQPWLVDRRWIQAGWALSAKQGFEQVRVQVLTAEERRPVRGVEVRLRTGTNRPIGPILTDAQGVAVLRHSADDPVEIIIATKRGATAVLDLTRSAVLDDRRPLYGGDRLEAYILPSQDRFRRGDPLPVFVVVRQPGLTPPSAGLSVDLQLVSADGRAWARQEQRLWRTGAARFDLRWPTEAPNGIYTLNAVVAQRVIGRTKVRLQGQQALVDPPLSVSPARTSTGSQRLSWTPIRPRPAQGMQVRWLAPAPGWVTVSLESTQVLSEVRRRVPQGPAIFSFAVPREARPGAHLVVTFEPTGEGHAQQDRAWVAVGRRRRLPVELELPPGPHVSGSPVLATVRVPGAPEGANVLVRVVAPEAVDSRLEAHRDLFAFLHRYRPPSWRTHVPSGRFTPAPIERVEVPAPSAAPLLAAAGSFMTDAARLGRSDQRRISLKLPQRQGTLMVEALVWADGRYGAAVAELEVRDPLALDAAAPPVLFEGDSVELPVTLFRGQEGPATVRLTASTSGGVEVVGPAVQQIEVGAGAQVTTTVRLVATGDGSVKLEAAIDEGPSVTWQRTLAVRPVAPPLVVGVGIQAKAGAPVTLPWPSVPGRARVAVGARRTFQLATAVTRLARAERDDLETVAAQAMARQTVGDLSRPDSRGAMPGVAGAWTTSVSEIDRCLGPDGPRAWPDGPPADGRSVVLAGHAIASARGRAESPNFARWMEAVRSTSRSGSSRPRTIAYGQWVLALAGQPDKDMLAQLRKQWAERPPDLATGVGLAAALTKAGRRPEAQAFLKFSDASTLDAADAAFVLAALTDANPEHPVLPELTQQLISVLSTAPAVAPRTDALAVVGLDGLQPRLRVPRKFWATLTLGEEVLERFGGLPRAVVGDFDDAARTQGEMQLKVNGGAPVFASLVVEGPSLRPSDGSVKVDLRLLDEDGQPATKATVGQRLTILVTIDPLSTDVSDLRVAVPIPSGLTVTDIQAPTGRARIARNPGLIAFDLRASANTTLQAKLQVSATYAGDFAFGPVIVSSALWPTQRGASEARRLPVAGR